MSVEDDINHNIGMFMRDGPKLRMDYRTPVLQWCSIHNRMLLTGVGSMGIGTMWCDIWSDDVHERYALTPELDACRDMTYSGERCDGTNTYSSGPCSRCGQWVTYTQHGTNGRGPTFKGPHSKTPMCEPCAAEAEYS